LRIYTLLMYHQKLLKLIVLGLLLSQSRSLSAIGFLSNEPFILTNKFCTDISFSERFYPDKKLTFNPEDTVTKVNSDSSKHTRKDFFKIDYLNIKSEGFYTEDKYLNQGLENAYVRTSVMSKVTVGGVPFNLGGLVSTENNTGLNQINNFRFGLDAQSFKESMRKKMIEQSDYDKMIEARSKQLFKEKLDKMSEDSSFKKRKLLLGNKKGNYDYPSTDEVVSYTKNINYHVNDLSKKISKINLKLNDPNYLDDIALQKKILEEGEKDTSMQHSHRYKNARKKMDEYELLQSDHEFFSKINDALKQYETLVKMEKIRSMKDLPNENNDTKRFKGLGFKKHLLSVNKLDIGMFNASYSSLIIDGVSLVGFNIEVNEGNFYSAFMAGYSNISFSNPFAAKISGNRNVIAGRLGYGNVNKALFAITVLKGSDPKSNLVGDNNYTYYQPNDNYVIGSQFTYKFQSNLYLELEYARSLNVQKYPIEGRPASSDAMGTLLKKDIPYSNAYSGKITYVTKSARTKVYLLCRQVDPLYFSFGAPILRHDNFRTEIKLDQKIYKDIVSASSSLKFDRDNLYEFKSGTARIISSVNTVNVRFKSGWAFSGNYTPIKQTYYAKTLGINRVSYLNLTSLVVSRNYIYKNIMSTTSVGISKFWSRTESNQSSDTAINKLSQYNYSFTEVLTLRKQEASLMYNLNYIKQGQPDDSSSMVISTLSVNYKLFDKKLSVVNGGTFQNDMLTESRYIIFYSLGINIGKHFNIIFGHDIQLIRNLSAGSEKNSHVFRLKGIISI
jgi:hypothetical protein